MAEAAQMFVDKWFGDMRDDEPIYLDGIRDCVREAMQAQREALEPYCSHDSSCIWAQCSEGRPTADGGYEMGFGYGENKKWYPKDEPPPCTCGLDDALRGVIPEVEIPK